MAGFTLKGINFESPRFSYQKKDPRRGIFLFCERAYKRTLFKGRAHKRNVLSVRQTGIYRGRQGTVLCLPEGEQSVALSRHRTVACLIFSLSYFFFSTIAIKFKYFPPPAFIAFLSPTAYSFSCASQSFQHSSLLSISLTEITLAPLQALTIFVQ